MIQDVQRLSHADRSLLDESTKILDAEESEDARCRSQFSPSQWRRQSSKVAGGTLRGEIEKYGATMDAASQSDALVRNKFLEWEESIVALASPSVRASDL